MVTMETFRKVSLRKVFLPILTDLAKKKFGILEEPPEGIFDKVIFSKLS